MYVSLAVSMLDAPVSGGVMAAETATLTFMVRVAFDRWFIHEIHFSCKPVEKFMIPSRSAHTVWSSVSQQFTYGTYSRLT